MSVLDFLFEGKPPASVTTYGKTAKDVPKWMSDYTQGLIARANAVAAEGYIPYEGPRIAGFDPDQLEAFNRTRENVGNYQPFFDESAQMSYDAGTTSPLDAAQPYQEAASQRFQGASVDDYMSPYVDNVLDRQSELAERNLSEKFLPGLQKAFIGAGQFGSKGGAGSRSMEDLGIRGVRDISEGLQSQQQAYLDQAYQQAGTRFDQDQARQLQLAQQAGQFSTAGAELGLRGAQQIGALGESTQRAGLTDAAALETIGATQRQLPQSSLDLAYEDFERQRNFPRENVAFLSETIRGLPSTAVPQSTRTQQTGPAEAYQPSGLSQIAAAYGAYKGLTGNKRGGLIKTFPKMHTNPEFLMKRYAGGGLVLDGEYEVVT